MCLAIPMQVVELKGNPDDLFDPQVALVETDGIRKEIRLEMVDRVPEIGEYVIIHAGFAIRKLDLKEAQESLTILRDLANAYEEVQRKYDQEALDRAKA